VPLRFDRWSGSMAAIAAVSFGIVLWLGRGMTFFWDEWDFIARRSLGDPSTWWLPHNEHWSTLPILVYRAIVETIGIGSYVPYLAVVGILHLAVVAAVYRLVRLETRSGPVAVGAGTLIALFGSGFENLFWGFQTGFVAATALCLWAMVVLHTEEPRSASRMAAATVLLVLAFATAGVAIAFGFGIGVALLSDPRRHRDATWILIPLAVWGIWYVAIGRTASGFGGYAIGSETPGVVLHVLLGGLANAGGSISGLGPQLGILAIVVIAAVALVQFRRRRLAPGFIGAIAALAFFYGLLGLTRGSAEPEVAANPRFTYESGLLLLVGIAALVGPIRWPTRPQARLTWTASAAAVLVLALVFNLRLLLDGREVMLERADFTRALITAELDPGRPATVDPNRSMIVVPAPALLADVVRRYGSPLTDSLAQDAVRPIPPEALDKARTWLRDGPPPNIRPGGGA
jgi:hypothetical protein